MPAREAGGGGRETIILLARFARVRPRPGKRMKKKKTVAHLESEKSSAKAKKVCLVSPFCFSA